MVAFATADCISEATADFARASVKNSFVPSVILLVVNAAIELVVNVLEDATAVLSLLVASKLAEAIAAACALLADPIVSYEPFTASIALAFVKYLFNPSATFVVVIPANALETANAASASNETWSGS